MLSFLKFDENAHCTIKWGNERILLLRDLKSFDVCENILCCFFSKFCREPFNIFFCVLFQRVVWETENVEITLSGLLEGFRQKETEGMTSQPDQILLNECEVIPSGQCHCVPTWTNGNVNSFIPFATISLGFYKPKEREPDCGSVPL